MRLVSKMTLSAVLALGGLLWASSAHAQSTIGGTMDRQSIVFTFQMPNSGASAINALINPTPHNRPRGIDYDRAHNDLYVSEGYQSASATGYLEVFDRNGVQKRTLNAAGLSHFNDVDYHAGKLFASNAYVYGGSNTTDRNIYVFNTPTVNNSTYSTFATLSSSVFSGNVWFNGIEFGPDGNMYAIQQTGSSGTGTGYIRRFDGATGALIDTPVNGTHKALFGVTFDPSGNLYFGAGDDIYVKSYLGGGLFGADTLLSSNLDTTMLCDIYYATDGYLYAAALTRHSLFKIDPSNGNVLNFTGNGLNDPKNDFLTEIFPAAVVPEPGTIAFGIIAAGSILGLIARKRKA